MAYLGRVELKSSDIQLKASTTISGSSTNTVVLTWTAPTEQSIILKVNGVVQHTDAYSIAGSPTTITLASGNFADAAVVEVVGINDIGKAIVPADSSVTALKIANSTITPAQMANSAFLANRNIVQNGAMQICQRATTVTGLTAGPYTTCDRWRWSLATLGTWTSAQETLTTGNAFADGFRKSFRIDCTTADASPAAGDVFVFQQRIEGYNAQGLKKGTANAESTTISFWVKSNTTGTYSFGLFDTDNDRNIWQLYTISVADTWEKKTITFAGDTTGGTLNNDNNSGLEMWWYIGAGSNYTTGTLQTRWGANTWANNAVGTTQLAASTANDWAITGVQLEIGTTATPFEHQSFGQELATCQRYYQLKGMGLIGGVESTSATVGTMRTGITYNPEMRAAPTVGVGASTITYNYPGVAAMASISNAISWNSNPTSKGTVLGVGNYDNSGRASGDLVIVSAGGNQFTFDAEL